MYVKRTKLSIFQQIDKNQTTLYKQLNQLTQVFEIQSHKHRFKKQTQNTGNQDALTQGIRALCHNETVTSIPHLALNRELSGDSYAICPASVLHLLFFLQVENSH